MEQYLVHELVKLGLFRLHKAMSAHLSLYCNQIQNFCTQGRRILLFWRDKKLKFVFISHCIRLLLVLKFLLVQLGCVASFSYALFRLLSLLLLVNQQSFVLLPRL